MSSAVPDFGLVGKVALVTGVGEGIGLHVVRVFAAAGARVVFCSRNPDRVASMQTAAAQTTDRDDAIMGVVADIAEAANIDRLVQTALERFGRIDVVFNNAYTNPAWTSANVVRGTPPDKDTLDYSTEDWEECFNVNVLAPYRLAQHVVPLMQDQGGGSIINVLSVAAFRPAPPAVAYGVSKAALSMLTRYLAKSSGPVVRVNAICPGSITPDGDSWKVFEPLLPKIPAGRVGRASDIGGAALYLASSASDYVTGQVIYVDGGRTSTVG
jgi:NAD(P)-dependent dehydrogenase (short-subunit alcohol dehydrogenase family)